jgi:uncharacterized membrane protein
MVFPEDILIRVILFALGAFGFWVARHIYVHKRSEEKPLVCMVGFDCHAVVHSDYAKFLGIHVEVLGMFYYGAVTLFYAFLLFLANTLPIMLTDFMILLSFTAFLFSAYLIGIQQFVIKKWCSWCLVSASVSTTIFIVTILFYNLSEMFAVFLK